MHMLKHMRDAGEFKIKVPMAYYPEVAEAFFDWARRPKDYNSLAIEKGIKPKKLVMEERDKYGVLLQTVTSHNASLFPRHRSRCA